MQTREFGFPLIQWFCCCSYLSRLKTLNYQESLYNIGERQFKAMKNIVIITKFIRNVFFKIISSTFSFEIPRYTAGCLTFSLIFSDSQSYRLVMEKNSSQLEQYLSKYLHPKYLKKIMKSLSNSWHMLTKNKFYLQGNSCLSYTHIIFDEKWEH